MSLPAVKLYILVPQMRIKRRRGQIIFKIINLTARHSIRETAAEINLVSRPTVTRYSAKPTAAPNIKYPLPMPWFVL